jgi:hypothetical protein
MLLSKDDKKSNADLITERSLELFGLTPEEISDQNEIWMQKRGYKNKKEDDQNDQYRQKKISGQDSRLNSFLKRLRIQKRK